MQVPLAQERTHEAGQVTTQRLTESVGLACAKEELQSSWKTQKKALSPIGHVAQAWLPGQGCATCDEWTRATHVLHAHLNMPKRTLEWLRPPAGYVGKLCALLA